MKLESVRIENFRSFQDETIYFDDYTCFVGPNGCGKSTVLMALNVFFRNTSASVTNVVNLSRQDFHHEDTSKPVMITVTFKDLSRPAIEDLALYYRQDRLTISAKAFWSDATESAEVKQYGQRLVMQAFAPYFKGLEEKKTVGELKPIYDEIQKQFPDLPNATSGPARLTALRAYEESHPELCELVESDHEFFGFTKGANLLAKYVQWIYVPAVKEASSEQEEGSKTALGQLFQRSIRSKVKFKDSIADLKKGLEKQYRDLIESENEALEELSGSIQKRLREWANPNARLQLMWHFDPNKTLVVQEPVARASIGEDKFIGEVARLGHGMQRSFLVAILHELASTSGEEGPTLLLGMEEPELYQHPSQALHIANVLEQLAENKTSNAQVMISTHSPHFVSGRGFENVRVVRKHAADKCSLVAGTTFERYEKRIADAVGEKPDLPSVVMTSIEQIMQPSLRELYFTKFAILVEGIEDVAFIAAHLKMTGRWNDFRKHGCHIITAGGKSNLSRPIAIAQELCIRHFVVFDADSKDKTKGNKRDNDCLFNLLGARGTETFPEEIVWNDKFVTWPGKMDEAVKADIGPDIWAQAETEARKAKGYIEHVNAKNVMLIAAIIEELANTGHVSGVLSNLCNSFLREAELSFQESAAQVAA